MGRTKELLYDDDRPEEDRLAAEAEWRKVRQELDDARRERERAWAKESPREWAEWVRLQSLLDALSCAWEGYEFPQFLKEFGPRPSMSHAAERIDPSQPHLPGNIYWAEKAEKSDGRIARELRRIARAIQPPEPDVVGSRYVAGRLGVTTQRVGQMATKGDIPAACVVTAGGKGLVWKFDRKAIDKWIKGRKNA